MNSCRTPRPHRGRGFAGTALASNSTRGHRRPDRRRKARLGRDRHRYHADGTGAAGVSELGVLDRCLAEGAGFSEMTLFNAAGDLSRKSSFTSCWAWTTRRSAACSTGPASDPVRNGAGCRGPGGPVPASLLCVSSRTASRRAQDGTTATWDLVVGADGWRSTVRRLLLGSQEPQSYFLGQAVWRAVLARPESLTGEVQFYGPGVKAGLTPIAPDTMYLFLVEPDASPELRSRADRPARRLRELLEPFGGDDRREVRDGSPNPSIDVRTLTALLLPAPWYRGRVLLSAMRPMPPLHI